MNKRTRTKKKIKLQNRGKSRKNKKIKKIWTIRKVKKMKKRKNPKIKDMVYRMKIKNRMMILCKMMQWKLRKMKKISHLRIKARKVVKNKKIKRIMQIIMDFQKNSWKK